MRLEIEALTVAIAAVGIKSSIQSVVPIVMQLVNYFN